MMRSLLVLFLLLLCDDQFMIKGSLSDHFRNQIVEETYGTLRFGSASFRRSIFHLDFSHFEDIVSHNETYYYEALIEFEHSLSKGTRDKVPFIMCGSQHYAKVARSEISKYDSGRISIVYASRLENIACWRASLTTGEANTLADSPTFFHMTQVPTLSKFVPNLITKVNDQIVPSGDIINNGIVVQMDQSLDYEGRNKLIEKWEADHFGLTSHEHLNNFFPTARLHLASAWKSVHNIITKDQCHTVVFAAFASSTRNTNHLVHMIFKTLGHQSQSDLEACVLSTLIYLATENRVVNIEHILSHQLQALVFKYQVERDHRNSATPRNVNGGARILNTISTTALQSGNKSQPKPFWDLGLNGTGQFVEVADTGFDDASCFFREAGSESVLTGDFNGDVQVARSTYDAPTTDTSFRKIVQYLMRDSSEADYGYDYASGHGTHVAGTIAGSNMNGSLGPIGDFYANCADNIWYCNTFFSATGDFAGTCDTTCDIPSTENYDGVAPGAKLMVYDFGDDSGSLSVPTDMATKVFYPAYNEGARIFSNSWGTLAPSNYYNTQAINIDEFIYHENDALILFTAGNSGGYYGDDTYSAGDASVSTPGICKNVLTVGAAETAYTPNTVADFSSRGPSKDMRLKPDVIGPGDPVVSAKASGSAGLASCGVISMSGTSSSTPAIAGTAAIVRQILIDGHHKTFSSEGFRASSYSTSAPSGALMKAILIGSTVPLTYGYDANGNSVTLADFYSASSAVADSVAYSLGTTGVDFTQGFGHVRLSNVFSLDGSFDTFLYEDSIEEYSTWTKYLVVTTNITAVSVTLVWMDPPGSSFCGGDFEDGATNSSCLVHDLDLKVYNDGTRLYSNFGAGDGDYSGQEDTFNNVEKVTIPMKSLVQGNWITITVASNGLSYNDSQKFAVVVIGDLQTLSPTPVPSLAPTSPSPLPTPLPSSLPTYTTSPTFLPIPTPTTIPTAVPLPVPSSLPIPSPSSTPTIHPTSLPTSIPIPEPSLIPTPSPSSRPTNEPTVQPSPLPTTQPSPLPIIAPTPVPSFQPTMEPTSSPTIVPFPQPTVQPSYQPTQIPTSSPFPLPSPSPTFFPTALPSSLPFPSPTPQPTLIPSPSPTIDPSPAPTKSPTLSPSPVPTSSPTSIDTFTMAVSFQLTSSSVAGGDDESSLKSIIVASLNVPEASIKAFELTSSLASRRRLLTSFVWSVGFKVTVALSTTSASSPEAFVSSAATILKSSAFASSVSASTGASVDTSSVTTVLVTRSPTFAPIPIPTQPPTHVPTDINSTGQSNSSTKVDIAMLSGIGVGFLVCLLGIFVGAYWRNDSLKSVHRPEVVADQEPSPPPVQVSQGIEMEGFDQAIIIDAEAVVVDEILVEAVVIDPEERVFIHPVQNTRAEFTSSALRGTSVNRGHLRGQSVDRPPESPVYTNTMGVPMGSYF